MTGPGPLTCSSAFSQLMRLNPEVWGEDTANGGLRFAEGSGFILSACGCSSQRSGDGEKDKEAGRPASAFWTEFTYAHRGQVRLEGEPQRSTKSTRACPVVPSNAVGLDKSPATDSQTLTPSRTHYSGCWGADRCRRGCSFACLPNMHAASVAVDRQMTEYALAGLILRPLSVGRVDVARGQDRGPSRALEARGWEPCWK
ncbi:hypothetical protein VTG60DRAFT_3047 [Thermothelomyces hinnuleus]